MRRLTHFCIRHGLLPDNRWLRRRMLRSIFHPVPPREDGLTGMYDLGLVGQKEADQFKEWAERE